MKTSTFIMLMAATTGFMQNRQKISDWLNPPPPASHAFAKKEVILYSTTWCGYCAKTRKYFAQNHINYTDFDIEHSEKGRNDYERLGGNGVPIIVINKETVIHGYSPEEINNALSQ
jgi:glutaredoxin